MGHEELAEAILFSPALQRFHTVFRHDRLPVVPAQAVAQRECILHSVRGDGSPIDHLRSDLKALIRTEQGIINQIAVVARDVGGRPNRIEDFQIGVRHEAKGLTAWLGADRRRAKRQSCCSGTASDDLSATDAVHSRTLPAPCAPRPSHPHSLPQNAHLVTETNLNCSESMRARRMSGSGTNAKLRLMSASRCDIGGCPLTAGYGALRPIESIDRRKMVSACPARPAVAP